MLERVFALKERNTTVRTEILAGLTTFITMAYILLLAPNLLSLAGMDKDAVLIATALGGGLVTIAMGVFVNYPIALAPGVGLLAFLFLHRGSRYGVNMANSIRCCIYFWSCIPCTDSDENPSTYY